MPPKTRSKQPTAREERALKRAEKSLEIAEQIIEGKNVEKKQATKQATKQPTLSNINELRKRVAAIEKKQKSQTPLSQEEKIEWGLSTTDTDDDLEQKERARLIAKGRASREALLAEKEDDVEEMKKREKAKLLAKGRASRQAFLVEEEEEDDVEEMKKREKAKLLAKGRASKQALAEEKEEDDVEEMKKKEKAKLIAKGQASKKALLVQQAQKRVANDPKFAVNVPELIKQINVLDKKIKAQEDNEKKKQLTREKNKAQRLLERMVAAIEGVVSKKVARPKLPSDNPIILNIQVFRELLLHLIDTAKQTDHFQGNLRLTKTSVRQMNHMFYNWVQSLMDSLPIASTKGAKGTTIKTNCNKKTLTLETLQTAVTLFDSRLLKRLEKIVPAETDPQHDRLMKVVVKKRLKQLMSETFSRISKDALEFMTHVLFVRICRTLLTWVKITARKKLKTFLACEVLAAQAPTLDFTDSGEVPSIDFVDTTQTANDVQGENTDASEGEQQEQEDVGKGDQEKAENTEEASEGEQQEQEKAENTEEASEEEPEQEKAENVENVGEMEREQELERNEESQDETVMTEEVKKPEETSEVENIWKETSQNMEQQNLEASANSFYIRKGKKLYYIDDEEDEEEDNDINWNVDEDEYQDGSSDEEDEEENEDDY